MSRDSIVLWLGIIGASVAYLMLCPPPWDWGYQDYLKALAFLVATVSGKLATSPLPGKEG